MLFDESPEPLAGGCTGAIGAAGAFPYYQIHNSDIWIYNGLQEADDALHDG